MYKMARNLVATDNGNTVRMYHYNLETEDYRPTHTFKITVNEDNSLSYSTWDQFIIHEGVVYHPDVELYDFGMNMTIMASDGELKDSYIKNVKHLLNRKNWMTG